MDPSLLDRARAARGEEFERLARTLAPEAFGPEGAGARALRNLELPAEDVVFWLDLLGRKAPYSDGDLELLQWRLWETERPLWVAAARVRGRFAAQGGKAWESLRDEAARRSLGGRSLSVAGSDDRRLAVALGQLVALGPPAGGGEPPPVLRAWLDSGVPPVLDPAELGDSDLSALLTAIEPTLPLDRHRPAIERWLAAASHALPRRFLPYSVRCLVGLLRTAADAGCAPASLPALLETTLCAVAEFRPPEPELAYRLLREVAGTLEEAVALRRAEPVARALERLPAWNPVLAALFARALARLGGSVAAAVLEERFDGDAPLRPQALAFLLLDVCRDGRAAGEVRYWAQRRFSRLGLAPDELAVDLARSVVDLARTPDDWRRLPRRLRGEAVWLAGELGNSVLDFATVRVEEIFGDQDSPGEGDPRAAYFARLMARLEAAGSGADELASATKKHFLRFGDLGDALALIAPQMPLNLEKALAAWLERRLLDAAVSDPLVLLYRLLTRRPPARFLDRLFADRGRPEHRQLRKIVRLAVRLVDRGGGTDDPQELQTHVDEFYAGLLALSGDDPAREEIDIVGRSRFLPLVRALIDQIRALRTVHPLDSDLEQRLRALVGYPGGGPIEGYAREVQAPEAALAEARRRAEEALSLRAKASASVSDPPAAQLRDLESLQAAVTALGESVGRILAFPEAALWRALVLDWTRRIDAHRETARGLAELETRVDLLSEAAVERAFRDLRDLQNEQFRAGDPDGRRSLGFRRHLLARCLASPSPAAHLDAFLAHGRAPGDESVAGEALAHRMKLAVGHGDFAWADDVLLPSLEGTANPPLAGARELLRHAASREAALELATWLLDRYEVPGAQRVLELARGPGTRARRWEWMLHYSPLYVATLAGCVGLLDIGDTWDRLVAAGHTATALAFVAGALFATYAYILGDARRRSAPERRSGAASLLFGVAARRVQRVLAAAFAIALAINCAVLGMLGDSRPISVGDRVVVLGGSDFALQVVGWAALSLFIGVFLTILAQGGSLSRSSE